MQWLFHVAPIARRESIREKGILPMSWNGVRLIAWYAKFESDLISVVGNLAQAGHRLNRLDVWRVEVPSGTQIHGCAPWFYLDAPVLPSQIELVGSAERCLSGRKEE